MRNFYKSLTALVAVTATLAGSPVFADDFSVALKNNGSNSTGTTFSDGIKSVAHPWTIEDYVNNQRAASGVERVSFQHNVNQKMVSWQDALGTPPRI